MNALVRVGFAWWRWQHHCGARRIVHGRKNAWRATKFRLVMATRNFLLRVLTSP